MGSLLSRVDLEIKDKKGVENIVANHLSHLPLETSLHNDTPINEIFLDKHFMSCQAVPHTGTPWYVDVANYLITKAIPSHWFALDKRNFFQNVRNFF